jgi:hypothetical protein
MNHLTLGINDLRGARDVGGVALNRYCAAFSLWRMIIALILRLFLTFYLKELRNG